MYLLNTNRCCHLRADVREPPRRPVHFFAFFRLRVRARKPSSLALRADVREPPRRPVHFFAFFRLRVRARKPSSLALRADVREPHRDPALFPSFPVTKFAHETQFIGFAGRRAQTSPRPVHFSLSSGSGFAHENRVHWLCGQTCANLPAPGPLFSLSSGSGFALGNRVRGLRADVREPPDLAAFFAFFRLRVRARKPSSLAFAGRRARTSRQGRFSLSSGSGFALENRVHWLCGQTCANLLGARSTFSLSSGSGFALENRVHWLCGQPCANHAGAWALFSSFLGIGFALENRIHWLCGQPCANHAAARALFPPFPGSKFALENRIHWLCGQPCANPVPHAGARASGRSLAQKKESSDFKIEIAAPFI